MTTKKNGTESPDLRKKFASLWDTFGSDPELETKGILLDYALENGKRVEFRIRRAGARNADWKRSYNEAMKELDGSPKNLTEEQSAAILAKVYADTVVLDWGGVEDANGEPVPFTKENCREVLILLPDLLQMLVNDAHLRSNFRTQATERSRKN